VTVEAMGEVRPGRGEAIGQAGHAAGEVNLHKEETGQ